MSYSMPKDVDLLVQIECMSSHGVFLLSLEFLNLITLFFATFYLFLMMKLLALVRQIN